jgi:hypothetical protein
MMRSVVLHVLLACSIGLALVADVAAQQEFEGFFRSSVGDLKFRAFYNGTLYPDRSVSGQNTEMGLSRHQLRLFAPLLQEKDHFEWSVVGGVTALFVDSGAILPDTGQAFPDGLWDVGFGTTVRWKLENGWIVGGHLGVESASDRPFNSIDETSINTVASLRVPWQESLAWIFGIYYSNLGEFPYPLPSVALAYEPGRHLQVLAGLPLAIRWAPTGALEFFASYYLVRNIRARASYRLMGPVWLYAGFDWDNQRYFRHDRSDTDARLTYYEKRVSAGIRWDVTRIVSLDASGGYAFDRFWFEGETYSDRNFNRLDLADGPFAMLRLSVRF